MIQQDFLNVILRRRQTVFSFNELLLIFRTNDINSLKSKLSYYIKKGDLYHIRRGLYAKSADYDRFEVATRILKPAYISFETVLRPAGMIFQYYSQIFVASYQTREIECDGQTYIFKRLKSTILVNGKGVEVGDAYSIASPERAFLDTLYLHDYYFDNLRPLDWDKVYEILPFYGNNKSLKKKVDQQYAEFKEKTAI